jgi:hypothetical protein
MTNVHMNIGTSIDIIIMVIGSIAKINMVVIVDIFISIHIRMKLIIRSL